MESGGILSGKSILNALKKGEIEITPFQAGHVLFESRMNPASYDLTLGPEVAVYTATTIPDFGCVESGIPGERVKSREWESVAGIVAGTHIKRGKNCLDAARENEVARHKMDNRGFVLMPGVGYLMHTAEKICSNRYVPILDGKSSIGRLFCFVHVTAGYGDPGFDGQYTLEVVVMQPLVVYPGMRFCQIRFHTIVGEFDSYKDKGNYKGVLADGPVPSQSWKMFNGA